MLNFTDNAGDSPQSLTISGTAVPAANIGVSAGGSATSPVSAGQVAQYNLQATPGAGFTGTLTFTCSGAPFGASCTVPGGVTLSNGSVVPFNVSVSTLGTSQLPPLSPEPFSPAWPNPHFFVVPVAAILCLLLLSSLFQNDRPRTSSHWVTAACAIILSVLVIVSGNGCSGGGSATQVPPPPQSAATPMIQPAGGTFTGAQSVSLSTPPLVLPSTAPRTARCPPRLRRSTRFPSRSVRRPPFRPWPPLQAIPTVQWAMPFSSFGPLPPLIPSLSPWPPRSRVPPKLYN
jgi:hypothetical protein